MNNQALLRAAFTMLIAAGLGACTPDAPAECGRNVQRVTRLTFTGSPTITTSEDYDFQGYAVTASIDRTHADSIARICYVVRDDDPWIKFFWAVDDVLDASV